MKLIPDQHKDGFQIPLQEYDFQEEVVDGIEVILGLRPEHINLSNNSQKTHLELELKPTLIELTGYEQNVTFDLQGHEVTGRLSRNSKAKLGTPILLSLDFSEISLFDRKSTSRL